MHAARLDFFSVSPTLSGKLYELALALKSASIEQGLLDLVHIRASQLNGCAFCVDMHAKEAKIHGERELRVHHLTVWRESPLYSARERAALEWTEAVTQLNGKGIDDDVYARAREELSEQEITDLTYAISVINTWNRLSIAFRKVPGSSDAAYGLTRAGLH
jgi:AhpD family alkylhydroperoxidase